MQPTREIKEYVTHVAGDRQISLGAHGVSMCVCPCKSCTLVWNWPCLVLPCCVEGFLS